MTLVLSFFFVNLLAGMGGKVGCTSKGEDIFEKARVEEVSEGKVEEYLEEKRSPADTHRLSGILFSLLDCFAGLVGLPTCNRPVSERVCVCG